MERKRLSPGFCVRCVGNDVYLLSVSIRSLSRVLAAVQRLIDQREEEEVTEEIDSESKPADTDDRSLKLVKVTSGSAVYAIAAANQQTALKVLNDTGLAISNPSKSDWTSATLSSIEELSEVAKSIGCDIEFRKTPKSGERFGDIIATITPTTFKDISTTAFVHGQTSVYGKVLRVGGVTEMHCGVKIANRKRMLICRVSDGDLVRRLGNYVYQEVMMHGEATWLRHNWYLKHLTIHGFDPPKSGSILDTLDKIYDAGGKAWDNIADPDSYIAEMRTE